MNDEEQSTSGSLAGLEAAINRLEAKLDEQNSRLIALEGRGPVVAPVPAPAMPWASPAAAPPPPPPPAYPAETGAVPPPPPVAKPETGAMEEMIAGRWFAKIGVAVLAIGLTLFLKYAFDNDWIGETGRVVMGIMAGLAMLALGEHFIRRYFLYAQIISGGGLFFLYLSIYAAFNFYALIGQPIAFAAMAFVTAVGVVLAWRYDALSLVALAILGGFVTPFLITNGENNLFGLFSYILILDLAILAVSYFKGWRQLQIIGLVGSIAVWLAWSSSFYTPAQLWQVIWFLTLYFLVYSVSALVHNIAKKAPSTGTEQIITLAVGFFYFAACYSLLNEKYQEFMGFFALVMAVYYFFWAYFIRTFTPADRQLFEFLAFLSIGFITVAIPIQFKGNIITIGWLVESVLLLWLALATRQQAAQVLGLIVGGIALGRLITIDAVRPDESPFWPVVNRRFLTFAFAIAAAYLAAWLYRGARAVAWNAELAKKIMAASILIANLLTIYAGSLEITRYYDRQADLLISTREDCYRDNLKLPRTANSCYLDSEEMSSLRNRSSIYLSIFWLFYAIALILIGFTGRYKLVRLGGIALLSLSILKLFFYDLWSLGTLYRIISSICLGIVLLAISFLYQKYKHIIKESLI